MRRRGIQHTLSAAVFKSSEQYVVRKRHVLVSMLEDDARKWQLARIEIYF